ncbi:MAG: HD domain-containing protein, partial [Clostridia bacterium]|nr:HD domain-containing protein [Clostridia bacterium]
MEQRKFLEFLTVAEKLKCNTRHSFTTSGRKESVAEHSWRLALMAMLC